MINLLQGTVRSCEAAAQSGPPANVKASIVVEARPIVGPVTCGQAVTVADGYGGTKIVGIRKEASLT